MGAISGADFRLSDSWHLRGSVGLQLQHRGNWPRRVAGAGLLGRHHRRNWGDVQMANPTRVGHCLHGVATLVQVFGEDKAFDYPKALHRNISTIQVRHRPGEAGPPWRNRDRRELHARRAGRTEERLPGRDGRALRRHRLRGRFDVDPGRAQCNLDNAKKFADWALTPTPVEARWRRRSSISAVEQGGTATARGATFLQHQADSARFKKYARRRNASVCSTGGERGQLDPALLIPGSAAFC